ncbi:hypothetical protein P8C59_007473 [Phyllachora maydis]|uniref:Uncharacterized protein n=1 Tax=Phyllachora maydis TaxID=1825666 RepID=A0AAD9I9T0_9PEZI|nr:hypothetical protein P8C59_007473 [Phyllachora maydis]
MCLITIQEFLCTHSRTVVKQKCDRRPTSLLGLRCRALECPFNLRQLEELNTICEYCEQPHQPKWPRRRAEKAARRRQCGRWRRQGPDPAQRLRRTKRGETVSDVASQVNGPLTAQTNAASERPAPSRTPLPVVPADVYAQPATRSSSPFISGHGAPVQHHRTSTGLLDGDYKPYSVWAVEQQQAPDDDDDDDDDSLIHLPSPPPPPACTTMPLRKPLPHDGVKRAQRDVSWDHITGPAGVPSLPVPAAPRPPPGALARALWPSRALDDYATPSSRGPVVAHSARNELFLDPQAQQQEVAVEAPPPQQQGADNGFFTAWTAERPCPKRVAAYHDRSSAAVPDTRRGLAVAGTDMRFGEARQTARVRHEQLPTPEGVLAMVSPSCDDNDDDDDDDEAFVPYRPASLRPRGSSHSSLFLPQDALANMATPQPLFPRWTHGRIFEVGGPAPPAAVAPNNPVSLCEAVFDNKPLYAFVEQRARVQAGRATSTVRSSRLPVPVPKSKAKVAGSSGSSSSSSTAAARLSRPTSLVGAAAVGGPKVKAKAPAAAGLKGARASWRV